VRSEVIVDSLREILINLVAAAIIFSLGASTRSAWSLIRSWNGRRFWGRGILHGETLLFLGSFPRFRSLEPSGFVGVADARAVHELTAGLQRLGVTFTMGYSSRLIDGQPQKNLILFGSEEVNELVDAVLTRTGSGIRLNSDTMTLRDLREDKEYRAEWQVRPIDDERAQSLDDSMAVIVEADGTRTARRIRADYGALIRAHSPFDPERTVVIIFGIYGYGTLAGARLCLSPDFLARCARLPGFNIECIFRVDLAQGIPLGTSVLDLRPMTTATPPASSPADASNRTDIGSGGGPPPASVQPTDEQ
jgi:hypothetical protein